MDIIIAHFHVILVGRIVINISRESIQDIKTAILQNNLQFFIDSAP